MLNTQKENVTQTTVQKITSKTDYITDYFLLGLNRKVDTEASTKLTEWLCLEFEDSCKGIGYFLGDVYFAACIKHQGDKLCMHSSNHFKEESERLQKNPQKLNHHATLYGQIFWEVQQLCFCTQIHRGKTLHDMPPKLANVKCLTLIDANSLLPYSQNLWNIFFLNHVNISLVHLGVHA